MTDLTEGQRLYAIGDVHGRLDLLEDMLARVRNDLAVRPHDRPRVICLGDYVDRGPDSRGVIEALIALKASDLPAQFLLGNHDSYIDAYLNGSPLVRSYLSLAALGHGRRRDPRLLRRGRGERGGAGRDPRRLRESLPRQSPRFPRRLRLVGPDWRLCLRPRRHSPGRAARGSDARRLHLDPRAVPVLQRRLRLQGRPRPHHRARRPAPAQPHLHRHRRRQGRTAHLPRAGGRRGRDAPGRRPAPPAPRLRPWRGRNPVAPVGPLALIPQSA
ncbi:hypothetical protein CNY89_12945 [Amaricoccus sp. HAR-UPW-R2A-40]|nr:hypothetical protein CNY89_12945 [Amaricoccus sp. HAR-UPW-R2A-40]